MIHPSKLGDLVCHAITIGVEASQHLAAARLFAKRALLINAHKHLACRSSGEADGIVDVWWHGIQLCLKPIGHPHIGQASLHSIGRPIAHEVGKLTS